MEKTKHIKDPQSVIDRLKELRLARDGLLTAVETAISASAGVTANHANNAAGTYRYHEGTAMLRDQFVGEGGWVKDSTNNIEAIFNPEIGVKVVFQNVDKACSEFIAPQPSSPKKSASKRCIETNNLFDVAAIPLTFDLYKQKKVRTYYLMASDNENEVEAELSLVTGVTDSGLFDGFAERVFLSYPDWSSPADPTEDSLGAGDNDFSFEISRK